MTSFASPPALPSVGPGYSLTPLLPLPTLPSVHSRQVPHAPPEASTIAKFGIGQMVVMNLGKVADGVTLLTEAVAQEARAATPRR